MHAHCTHSFLQFNCERSADDTLKSNLLYVGERKNGNLNPKMEHLACFVPGMVLPGFSLLARARTHTHTHTHTHNIALRTLAHGHHPTDFPAGGLAPLGHESAMRHGWLCRKLSLMG
jgi:hypothetical protein